MSAAGDICGSPRPHYRGKMDPCVRPWGHYGACRSSSDVQWPHRDGCCPEVRGTPPDMCAAPEPMRSTAAIDMELRLARIEAATAQIQATVDRINRMLAELVGRCWRCGRSVAGWHLTIPRADWRDSEETQRKVRDSFAESCASRGVDPNSGHTVGCEEIGK